MFQLFLRARADQFFKARSADRDAEADRSRVESIARVIEHSLLAAQAEKAGLIRRLDDISARAAVSVGNGTDEYLTREALDNRLLGQLETEILNGQRRLEQLAHNITHFKFLRVALVTRFVDFKPSSDNS